MKNRTSILCAFAIIGGAGALLATNAQSQLGMVKDSVALQSANPGFSQSGNSNISGTSRAGLFAGNGNGLTNLNASALASGTLSNSLLSSNVARRDQTNTFGAGPNVFNGFLGVGRSFQVTGAETFGIGNSATSFDGMYIRTAASGLPFYGYSLGGTTSVYHFVDGSDANKWKLYHTNGIKVSVDNNGRVGIGTTIPGSALDVIGKGAFVNSESVAGASSVYGLASGNNVATIGVDGHATSLAGIGVRGRIPNSQSGIGVLGEVGGTFGTGVKGFSPEGYGVYGETSSNLRYAVFGIATNTTGSAIGGYFRSASLDGTGVVGSVSLGGTGYAVFASGRSGASGTKSFRIDHPLDPTGKYLLHYSAEGPEPLNVYSGNVVTDKNGVAWVELPTYFAEINRDLRYTLTVVDDSDSEEFVQVKVAQKVRGNRFKIRSSVPNVEVSWEVKGVRNDRFVQEYGAPVEREKPEHLKGKYQHPELYGQPEEMSETAVARPPKVASANSGRAKR